MMSVLEQLERRQLLSVAAVDDAAMYALNSEAEAQADSHYVGYAAAPAADIVEMQVYGNGVLIPDGSTVRDPVNGTDFGTVWYYPVEHTFEVVNVGPDQLVFSDWPAVTVTGANPEDFRVIRQPTPRLVADGSSLFIVQFIPTGSGTRTATISISSNDLDTTPYTFNVYGGSGESVAPDVYEPDGNGDQASFKYFDAAVTPAIAKVISTDGVLKVHSLHSNSDVDWSMFELTEDTDVLIETTSPRGDLRMYLYDALGQQVGYDNDSSSGLNAALHLSLRKGIYYVRVDEFGNNATVPLYGLSVRAGRGVQVTDNPAFLDGAGRLYVFGTQLGDTISVDLQAGSVRVALNESQYFFPVTDVRTMFVNGRDGADTIYIGAGIVSADVRGSGGSDAITVDTANPATVFGGMGNDVIFGGAGSDFINGKKGNDLIFAGGGNDYVQGGDGDDLLNGGDGDDILQGYWGNDLVYGDAGNDTLIGGIDELPAGATDNDTLYGGDGDDVLTGGPGRDEFYGEAGVNTMIANDGEIDLITRDPLLDVVVADDFDELYDSDSVLI